MPANVESGISSYEILDPLVTLTCRQTEDFSSRARGHLSHPQDSDAERIPHRHPQISEPRFRRRKRGHRPLKVNANENTRWRRAEIEIISRRRPRRKAESPNSATTRGQEKIDSISPVPMKEIKTEIPSTSLFTRNLPSRPSKFQLWRPTPRKFDGQHSRCAYPSPGGGKSVKKMPASTVSIPAR